MAEVLVIGKKISEMGLVNEITGEEKIPTGVVGDKAVTTGQLVEYLNNNGVAQWGRIEGDIANQVDLQNQFTQERDTLKSYTQDQVSQQQVALQEHIDSTSEVFEYARENGSALPYREGISYEEDAVVVKEGVLQQWKGGAWRSAVAESLSDTIQTFNTPEAGVDTVTGVAIGAYFNVRSSSDESYLDEYQSVGGVPTPTGKSYPSSAALNSIPHNNLKDRDAVDAHPASSISDESGKTQQQINNGLNSIAELLAVPNLVDGSRFTTKSYHAPNYGYAKPFNGGSAYVYNASMAKTNHNGGTVIAIGKVFPEDWTVREDVEAWFTAPSSGVGCWVAVNTGNQIDVARFGAMPNFNLGVDSSIAINKALSINNNIHIPSGNYIVHRPILTDKAFPIIGGSGGESTLITVEGANWQGVTFKGKAYNAAIVVTSGVQGSWIEGATLKDFSLLGNSYTSDGKIGIDFDNVCLKVNVSNVNISAFDKGIHTYKSWVHSYNNVTVTDCITNSMHFDTFANGYSLTGVCLYGRSVKTLCHLKFESACYGNSFNGGAIEHCWIGVSTRYNAQVNITGVDWEVIDQLFMENVDCVGLPSKIDSCSIMGNPSQSGFGVSNGQLVLENNKIFNPLGSQNIDAPIYFVDGTGGVVANNNKYGAHTTLIGGDGKVTGNDVGRFDFSKSRRITDGKILDAYSETYQAFFNFYTNTLDVYQSVSGTVLKTQVGNTYRARIDTLLAKYTSNVGDYFTFQFSELSNMQGVVGVFAFSPSNNLLGTDCITGQVICNSGTCYLMKSAGGLLTKAALNTTTDTNLFSLSLSYTDSI